MSTAPVEPRPEQQLPAHRVLVLVPALVQDLAAAVELAVQVASGRLVQAQAARPPLRSSPSNENGLALSEAILRFNSERRY